jgi:hypothetical protein
MTILPFLPWMLAGGAVRARDNIPPEVEFPFWCSSNEERRKFLLLFHFSFFIALLAAGLVLVTGYMKKLLIVEHAC